MGETVNCFKFITAITKLFGSFPVSQDGNKIVFRWCSFHTFYFYLSFLIPAIHLVYHIYENVSDYVHIALDICGMAAQISFLIMAINWSKLAKECNSFDFYMKDYGFPKYLKLKSYITCAILTIFCLVVYSVFNINLPGNAEFEMHTFIGVYKAIVKSFKEDASFTAKWKLLFPCVRLLSIFQLVTLRCCVTIFTVTVSIVLSSRFRQITDRIDLLIQQEVRDENVWIRIRKDYQRFCMFCEKWDDVTGYFVLTALVCNIYGLLVHIEGTLRTSEPVEELFTVLATAESLLQYILVCYTAGNVYEESRRLIRLLILTPSEVFNDEIERIILQLRQTQPALTGKQLLTVKHPLILQILGGVATHEIVLLQYNTH